MMGLRDASASKNFCRHFLIHMGGCAGFPCFPLLGRANAKRPYVPINSTSSISMNGQPEMSQTRMSFPPSSFRDFHWPWSVRADPWWPLVVMAHRHKRPPFSQNPQNLQTFSQICPIRTIWDLLGNNQESEGLLMGFRLFIIITLRGIAFHNSHPERTPQKCKCI